METALTTRRPSTRLVRRLIVAVLAVVAVGAASLPLWGGSASAAGYNSGVKYVDFRDGATACFDGQYPIEMDDEVRNSKLMLEPTGLAARV